MDLLLSRYSDIHYILNLDFQSAIRLIKKAYEKDLEKRLWEMWLTLYPNMDKKNFIDFEEFKNKIIKPNVETLANTNDVLLEVSEIRKKLERREN